MAVALYIKKFFKKPCIIIIIISGEVLGLCASTGCVCICDKMSVFMSS